MYQRSGSSLLTLTGTLAHIESAFITFYATDGFSYTSDYTTYPEPLEDGIRLDIYPGETAAKFTLFPVDDRLLSGDFEIAFSIESTSEGLAIGEISSFKLAVKEEDIVDPLSLHSISDLRSLFDNYDGDWYLPDDYYIQGIVTSASNVIDEKHLYDSG